MSRFDFFSVELETGNVALTDAALRQLTFRSNTAVISKALETHGETEGTHHERLRILNTQCIN